MTSPLSAWQELMLLGGAVVSLAYVLHFRIWLTPSPGADLLFVVSLALAFTGIAAPSPQRFAAGALIDQSPLPTALEEADARVARIAALPRELIDAALAKVGYERDEETEESDPEAGTPGPDFDPDLEAGPFGATIRPSVEGLLTLVLRGAGLVASGFAFVTALLLRKSTRTTRRLEELTERVQALEGRVPESIP